MANVRIYSIGNQIVFEDTSGDIFPYNKKNVEARYTSSTIYFEYITGSSFNDYPFGNDRTGRQYEFSFDEILDNSGVAVGTKSQIVTYLSRIMGSGDSNASPAVLQAINTIYNDFGDVVSVENKKKSLLKFGRNDDIGTSEEMVWLLGGFETDASGNSIDTISSSNAGDSQDVVIEGHTVSGSDLTFVVQTATLNGQSKVTLTTPLNKTTRMYNNDSSNFAGTVYVYEDTAITGGVPTDLTKAHLSTDGSNNQSLKCATSISSTDYWIVTSATFSVNRQNNRSVDFKVQVREFGKVWRTRFPFSAHSTGGGSTVAFDPPLIIPKNSDMRVVATSSGTTTGVEVSLNGYLASIVMNG